MEKTIEISDKCLTKEEILNYKSGNLLKEELRRIEVHIIDCPLCNDAIEEAEKLNQIELQDSLKLLQSHFKKKRKNRNNWKIIISSAAVLLISISTYFFNNNAPNQKLFSEYYSIYPDVLLHKRSTEIIDKFYEAMTMYNKKEYEEAIDIFKTIPTSEKNDSVNFYKALTLVELKKYSNANPIFEKIIRSKSSYFYLESLWYSSLVNIYQEEYDNAKQKLTVLSNSNSQDYSLKADNLLSKLEEIN